MTRRAALHPTPLPSPLPGDHPLRYFIEPVVLTANYAVAQGYEEINMAGLSGGGWSTTFAPAVDKRIKRSFPIAGSVPCAMRNPTGKVPGQKWTGDDDEDFEQSCMPPDHPVNKKTIYSDDNPGRPAFGSCNYTCQGSDGEYRSVFNHDIIILLSPTTTNNTITTLSVPARRARAGALPGADPPRVRLVLLLAPRPA